MRATTDAAKADNVSVHADALALLSGPQLLFVNAPVAGVEDLDFKAMFDGRRVLDDTPVMYWHLSGSGLGEARSPIPAGFYTVVAHEQRGAVTLRDAKGEMVAEGDLNVCIEPQEPAGTAAKPVVTGGIDSWDVGWTHVKVCGHVTVSEGGKSITITGCLGVSL
jgi:hypothetical protein